MKNYALENTASSSDQACWVRCQKATSNFFSNCLVSVFAVGMTSACVTGGAGLLRYLAKDDHYQYLASPLGAGIGALGTLITFPFFLFFSHFIKKLFIEKEKVLQGALLNLVVFILLILPSLSLAAALLGVQKEGVGRTVLSYLTSVGTLFLLASTGMLLFCISTGSLKKGDGVHSALFRESQRSGSHLSQTSDGGGSGRDFYAWGDAPQQSGSELERISTR